MVTCMAADATHACRVVAATNRPDTLDPALRRHGRLDREIAVPPPTLLQRESILRHHMAAMPLSDGVDTRDLAERCRGFTGADIAVLCREAAMAALSEEAASRRLTGSSAATSNFKGYKDVAGGPGHDAAVQQVTPHHFDTAFLRVRPSLVRGVAVEVQPLAWDDIGGLEVWLIAQVDAAPIDLAKCPRTFQHLAAS
jgi:transitional endoplasmic reticulum ATPase